MTTVGPAFEMRMALSHLGVARQELEKAIQCLVRAERLQPDYGLVELINKLDDTGSDHGAQFQIGVVKECLVYLMGEVVP